jgi:hypothetical protein
MTRPRNLSHQSHIGFFYILWPSFEGGKTSLEQDPGSTNQRQSMDRLRGSRTYCPWSKTWDSFVECITFHRLTVFCHDATEAQRYYKSNGLKMPNWVPDSLYSTSSSWTATWIYCPACWTTIMPQSWPRRWGLLMILIFWVTSYVCVPRPGIPDLKSPRTQSTECLEALGWPW